MEVLGLIILAVVTYAVAAYLVAKYAVDKLGARSGLFGAGIVTMFVGFIWNKIFEYLTFLGFGWYNADGELSWIHYVLNYGFLIMGLGGIVMIAVDLLKAINELRAWVAKKD